MQTHSQPGRYGSSTPCLLHLAIPSPVTSCFPSPSRALRVEQTRPAACPATDWLRPRSWRSPRQLGVTRTRTLRPDAEPSPSSQGPLSGSTTSRSATCPRRGYSAVQPDPLSAPRTAQPTPEGSQVPRESGRKKKSLVYWVREASAGIRFPVSVVSFQQIPGAGEERVATGGSTPAGSGGGVQGNPNSWKGPPTSGVAGHGVRNNVARSAGTTWIALNIVPRGTKLRRLIRTGHHREPGRGEGSPRCEKLGHGVVRSTKTLTNNWLGFWAQSTELGA